MKDSLPVETLAEIVKFFRLLECKRAFLTSNTMYNLMIEHISKIIPCAYNICDLNDLDVYGFDPKTSKLECELNRCGFPTSKLKVEVEGNAVILKGDYVMDSLNYLLFKRVIQLPNEADVNSINFDLTDPMFIRFSCNVSARGTLNEFSKSVQAGINDPKILNFSTARTFGADGTYSCDTCGLPEEHIGLELTKKGFSLKCSWDINGGFVRFSRNIRVNDRAKYRNFTIENDGSLMTVTGVE